ncbi:phosphatidylinositol N-acetylglucosaminyltransferase subunit H-like [Uloborus diversus]|uniref:phosphatidylinositol N-acetylglucosaminyltransferase subunit H-like n=1 Tax=Uloborus diversus TaxID=327109 RepID=UPI002408FFBC|nr:phosphatidylinositol N-acetylglucosaminyltransferase subunit H-like [Uloborus diversus]
MAWQREKVRKTWDPYGQVLEFSCIGGGRHSVREYVFSREAFSFRRWLLLMFLFSSLAFYCEFYNVNASFLGVFLLFLCLLLILKLHFKVKEESLLVMASLGLQLTTTFVTGRRASRLIPARRIQDVVLIEGIFMHRVLFYLSVLLHDPLQVEGVIPVFQNLLPRIECLEIVYQGVRDVLHLGIPDVKT